MSQDETDAGSPAPPPLDPPSGAAEEEPRAPLPNSAVAHPADPGELSPDGPDRTAPIFDSRPAVLKNPAKLPDPGDPPPVEDAMLTAGARDMDWVDREVPTEAELEARRERKEQRKRKARRKRRLRRAGIATAAVVALVLVLALAWVRFVFGGVERMPAVAGQAGAETPGTNYLVVGTNPSEPAQASRDPRLSWKNDLVNSDLVMLVHVDRGERAMYVISIPGDSAVRIPGHGIGKLPDAYAEGGAKLYTRTVEEMTGIKLDRVITLDMRGFQAMVDILDGVVVNVPSDACDETPGARQLDGQGALDYTALRECMPNGDLDRVARQQSLMKALMRESVDGGTVAHPIKLSRLIRSVAGHTTVEDGFSTFSMLTTAWSMRHLRTANTTFLTVPTATDPIATVNGVDYVRIAPKAAAELWQAVRSDRLAEYLQLSGTPTS